MFGRRRRSIVGALALAVTLVAAAGCAYEGQITVQLVGDSPAVVKESFKVEVAPHRVKGTTKRAKQVVRVDCPVTGVFDVREATGSAVLIQLFVVHLRTRPLPRGTSYHIDCAGPTILELPVDASAVQAVIASESGPQTPLSVQAPLTAIPIASGKRLRPERGTQLASLAQPPLPAGGYTVDLSFNLPGARAFRQKALTTALVACGRSKYLQPIRPIVTTMTRAPALTIQPSASVTSVSAPHLFGGIRSYGEVTRTLSCAR
jgi:hypothetical protein